MEIKQVIRRQYLVTFEEEEAQHVRDFLDGLQESDYDQPFKRNRVENQEEQAKIKTALTTLKEALQLAPAAHSDPDTRRL
jgi:hypothetical protein